MIRAYSKINSSNTDSIKLILSRFETILEIENNTEQILDDLKSKIDYNPEFWLISTEISTQNIAKILKKGVSKVIVDIQQANELKNIVSKRFFAIKLLGDLDNIRSIILANRSDYSTFYLDMNQAEFNPEDLLTLNNKFSNLEILIKGSSADSEFFDMKTENKIFSQIIDFTNKEEEVNEIFINSVMFPSNLVPTVVVDEYDRFLMLAYSNQSSLSVALDEGFGTYFSRKQGSIWKKGETSGNVQELINVRIDCDNDTLVFKVKQKNNACHLNNYSCTGLKNSAIFDTYESLNRKIQSKDPNSYTVKISKDEANLKAKIKEEALEVINYIDVDNLVWELGDLLYFLMVLMATKEVKPYDLINELKGRIKD
jgi:phosphoribosyl-ATP pyrophosphohydrolase